MNASKYHPTPVFVFLKPRRKVSGKIKQLQIKNLHIFIQFKKPILLQMDHAWMERLQSSQILLKSADLYLKL